MKYEQANLTIVASKLTAVGLVAGAAGIMVQLLTGIAEYPNIPGHRQSASGGPPGVTAVMAVGTGRRCGPGDPYSRRSVCHTRHGESPDRTGGGRLVYQCVGPDAGLITSVVAGMVATAQDYQTRP